MISIRRATPGQAGQLSIIAQAAKAHWGYPERWLQLWKPQLTFTPAYIQEHEFWVADIAGEPVAFSTLLEKEGKGWIENLWVSPAHMGNGLGRRLFLHALQQFRERGYRSVQLEADPNAAGFYERMGMHRIGERHSEVDGQPRSLPIMEIEL